MRGVPTLTDCGDLRGARVLLRLGLNVPIVDGVVAETFRLAVLLQTVRELQEKGARIFIIGHIGNDGTQSLRPVHAYLSKELGQIDFIDHVPFDAGVLKEGGVALLENIRRFEGEKENSNELVGLLAQSADMYVNEAFSDSHRAHASIVGVAKTLPSYIGRWFESELKELSRAFNAEHPFVFIVGGAKIDTKLPLVKKFLPLADTVYVGGALANDIWKSLGYEVGRSLVSSESRSLEEVTTHPRLMIPRDVVVERGGDSVVISPKDLLAQDCIVDIGPESLTDIRALADRARFVVWNGPLGNTEIGFGAGTMALAEFLAREPAYSMVGGGDTIAAISKLDVFDRFGFVSTGGGAMLTYLSDETLAGIEAIREYWGKV